jgi:hypothetical protein
MGYKWAQFRTNQGNAGTAIAALEPYPLIPTAPIFCVHNRAFDA